MSTWTVTTTLEIGASVLRGQLHVQTVQEAGRLVQKLVEMGATARAEKCQTDLDVEQCRHCRRGSDLHCPGCGTCWPGYTCTLLCDAEPDEIALTMGAVEDWQDFYERAAGGAG